MVSAQPERQPQRSMGHRPALTAGLIHLLLLLPLVTGCDGCRRAADETADKAKKEENLPAEALTIGRAAALPCGDSEAQSAIKLGHWFTVRQSLRSNHGDERGELQFSLSGIATDNVRVDNDSMTFVRPAVLPKGRMKRLDIRMLATLPNEQAVSRVETSMVYASTNARLESGRIPHRLLRGDEYQFVILTRRPERFDRFRDANWVRSSMGAASSSQQYTSINHYQLVIPEFDGTLDLPESALDWTSIAYVLWDDFSPSKLTPTQTQALVDWINFGGRLIVNGTPIVPELAASSLKGYLPIQYEGLVDLEPESLAALVQNHQVPRDTSSALTLALINNQSNRVRVSGKLKSDSWSVRGTDELITVKSVGRGEVVLTGFDLTSEWTDGWLSYDSFMNNVVLGRPARKFEKDTEDSFVQSFVDSGLARSDTNSAVRFMSRDGLLGVASGSASSPAAPASESSETDETLANATTTAAKEFQAHPLHGFGSWSDSSSVAAWLQSGLKENAGITIPDRRFVSTTLAVLIVLITVVNYILFRLLGRLEWAWFSIPVIAVIGAGYTARSMSVDFGLGRNQNDVSLLELQPNQSRGHLTRYLSIYNSLSGLYSTSFTTPDTCAAPVQVRSQAGMEPDRCRFEYSFSEGPTLSGFEVPSNRTRLLHIEQLIDVGGTIELTQDKLVNRSKLNLTDCTLLKCEADGAKQWARIAKLETNSSVLVDWQADAPESLPTLLPAGRQSAGSIRLVAQYQNADEDLTVRPETNRNQSSNWLLAHLLHPRVDRDRRDENLPPKIPRRETFESEVVTEPGPDETLSEDQP